MKYPMKHLPPMPLHASFKSKSGIKCKAEKAVGERHTAYEMRTEDTNAIFAWVDVCVEITFIWRCSKQSAETSDVGVLCCPFEACV